MSTKAMIAFLPSTTSWCKQDFPHTTLVYAGDTEGRSESDFNAMAKDAISAARITGSFSLQVSGVEEFDPDDPVDVLTFHPTPALLVARSIVQHWDKSEFKDFKPHATIGPAGSALELQLRYGNDYGDETSYKSPRSSGLPLSLYFTKIVTCWNDSKIVFDLSEVY